MKRKARVLLFLAIYTFGVAPPMASVGYAQEVPSPEIPASDASGDLSPNQGGIPTAELIQKAVDAYDELEFETALGFLDQALANEGNETAQIVDIYRYQAFIFIDRHQKERALDLFMEALKVKPDLRLDPTLRSPRIIDVFEDARRAYHAYMVRTDRDAPVIQLEQEDDLLPYGRNVEIRATIRDNRNIKAAQLYYRDKGAPYYSFSTMLGQGDDLFVGVIPAQAILGERVEYYLTAQDETGNSSFDGTPKMPHAVRIQQDPSMRPWYKKWWIYGVGAVVVGGVLAGVFLSASGNDPGGGTTTADVLLDLN